MCIIYAVYKKENLQKEWLDNGLARNTHGGGISWVENGEIHTVKSLTFNANDAWKIVQQKPAPFIIHFRIATVGGITDANCHPFSIGTQFALAQNGHAMSQYEVRQFLDGLSTTGKPAPQDLSDTATIAFAATHLGLNTANRILLFLRLFPSKYAILSATPQISAVSNNTPQHLHITGDFITAADGVYVSNSGYENRTPLPWNGYKNTHYDYSRKWEQEWASRNKTHEPSPLLACCYNGNLTPIQQATLVAAYNDLYLSEINEKMRNSNITPLRRTAYELAGTEDKFRIYLGFPTRKVDWHKARQISKSKKGGTK